MIVSTERLAVHFPRGLGRRPLKALDGVDLEVREGDFFALLGPNGAGKSTLMYCLLGLLSPTAGSVTVFGAAPRLGSRTYERIAYLPEEPHYHDYLTVEEAVGFYGALYGRALTPRKIREALERLGLAEFAGLRLSKCSKGMKQKVGIAQCLLNEPRLLFLDEPMRGLDPLAVKQFRDILLDLNRHGGTIVMNSHILAEVEQVASRVAILDHGRVVAQDEVRNLLRVDGESYVVAVDRGEGLPEYFERQESDHGRVVGRVPADRLFEFFDLARRLELEIDACNRQRATLEESFVRVLKGEDARA